MDESASYTLPAFREASGAVLLKVRAQPGASRNRIVGVHGDALKVAVTAPPEKGKANEAIAETLARHLGARNSQVRIHSGEAARDKWFRIEGFSADELKQMLTRLLRYTPLGNDLDVLTRAHPPSAPEAPGASRAPRRGRMPPGGRCGGDLPPPQGV